MFLVPRWRSGEEAHEDIPTAARSRRGEEAHEDIPTAARSRPLKGAQMPKKKRKNKKKMSAVFEKMMDPDDARGYLQDFSDHSDGKPGSSWKFNKNMQSWLLR